jgi:hypothetical protein
MVTRQGDEDVTMFYYDEIALGWAKDPQDDSRMYFVCTDGDNKEVHLIPIALDKFDQFVKLGQQTMAGLKIQIAGAHEMPKGVPNA